MIHAIPNLIRSMKSWAKHNKKEAIVIAIILTISISFHAVNMLSYPYFENDEATYSSRAWAFISSGQLDVHTYRYDHAPVGWMIIGLWFFLTGGTSIFGSLLVSGRVLMLIVHIVSSIFLYIITKRFSKGNIAAAAAAVVIFSVSPLGIYFQRRVLLDNLMVLAILISIFFLTKNSLRLKDYIVSGIIFGISVLIKLNAIFLMPAVLLLAWARSEKGHRVHAASYWLAFTGLTILTFFVFAFLKNELFSAPLDENGMPTHVSVVDTFKLQLGRGDFIYPWNPESSIRQAVDSWMLKDAAILTVGAFCSFLVGIVGVFRYKKNPYLLTASLIVIGYFLFLARGKLVLDLYVAPLIPLMAINIGLVFGYMTSLFKQTRARHLFITLMCLVLASTYFIYLPTTYLRVDETSNQNKAINWILENVEKDAKIVTDNYIFPAVAQQEGYEQVSYFFNAEYDPEEKERYGDDWRNIEYMVVTHEIMQQIKSGQTPTMRKIFDHSELVADFRENTSSFIDLDNYISTNGDWVQIYKLKSRNGIVLQDSWDFFRANYIIDYGQVIDTTNDERTTSSDQVMGMYRALQQDNKAMFSGIWQWSKDHLRYRSDDKLISWLWEKDESGEYSLSDSNTVCSADQRLAHTLFLGAEKWNDNELLKEAKRVTRDWWSQCVVANNGSLYVDSSADGSQDIRLLNPGYFEPAVYRYLSERMPQFQWNKLIRNGYTLLNTLEDRNGYIPNWIILQPSGAITSAETLIGEGANDFGLDSVALVQQLAKDYSQHQSSAAKKILTRMRGDILAYAQNDPNNIQAGVSLLIMTQLITIPGLDSQELYEAILYQQYMPDEGAWAPVEEYDVNIWSWLWHDLQVYLPDESEVELR